MNDFFKTKRLVIFFIVCMLLIGYILYSYAKLASNPPSIIQNAEKSTERGSIFDRDGYPLAVQTNFFHIGVSPKQIKDKEDFSKKIAPILSMTQEEVLLLINKTKSFTYLKKKVDSDACELVQQLADENNYNFISYEKIPGRIYPNNNLASQLIGYMGDEGKGLAGIEFSEETILKPNIENPSEKSQQNVFLTIDTNLQYKLEQLSVQAINDTNAESMMLIAANSQTGEILSYVSLPSTNLNQYNLSTPEERIDRPAMYAYEPGSVFKIFTVGLVYDEKGISPNDSFFCDGAYEKKLQNGESVKIKCLEHHGWLTPRDALRFSCNDVLGQISDRVSDEVFISRIKQLGFGQKTGIELPSETSGSVKEVSSKLWSARSKPTIAIGQEISVSALQMVQAATAIANGGIPVKLSVIHKITNKDGTIFFEHTPEYKDRVLSKSSADYVLSCMEETTQSGTGSRAKLGDVSIGVKTGTAQMANKTTGGYSDTDFLSNCMSIFPIDNPEIVLYIVIEKAKGETYAGRIVAPVIAQAADIIIDHLGMSRGGAASLEHNGIITISTNKGMELTDTVPDFTGKSKKDLLPLLNKDNVKVTINGSGWVTSQSPAAGTPFTENMTIELNLE